MTVEQRDIILELTRKNYEMLGCEFPDDLIEYLFESQHPDEHRCLHSAILAHNVYNKAAMDINDFFEWHGL